MAKTTDDLKPRSASIEQKHYSVKGRESKKQSATGTKRQSHDPGNQTP